MPLRNLRALYILPWSIALFGLLWLIVQRFPPSGTISFDVPFDGTSAWIDPFLPSERTTPPGEQVEGWRGQRILQDPVYTSARVPGIYERVEYEIDFRPIRQTLVEIGIQPYGEESSFDFKPLWFETLQSDAWRAVEAYGKRGFVKNGVSNDILHSIEYDHLAVWHATPTRSETEDTTGALRRYDVSLRGSHDFWARSQGGVIEFKFELQDSNRRKGRETLIFQIWRDEMLIDAEAFGIGGSQDQTMGTVFEKRIRWDHLEPGMYRVQFVAEDDVFIRSVETSLSHWVIGPRISFGDLVGYKNGTMEGIAWTNSRHIVLQTFHDEGLQSVELGKEMVVVARTHESYRLDRHDEGTAPIRLHAPIGDIRVIGDGYFSLSEETFFLPEPRRITAWTEPDREGIQAVITSYERPKSLGDGWYRGSGSFSLQPEKDELRIALSVPGILTRAGALDIRRVKLTYSRAPLSWSEWWRLIRHEAVNAWHRFNPSS